jgi:hypothetical protein
MYFFNYLSWKQEAMLGNQDQEVCWLGGIGNLFEKCDKEGKLLL